MTMFKNTSWPESSTCATQARHSSPFVEVRDTYPSDVAIISPLVDRLMEFVSRFRKGDNLAIELALREALANAIVHGNQEDPGKRVDVRCRCSMRGDVSITVQDEGEGFELDRVPDPTSPENQLRTSGRGVYLMKTLMDEVCFERKGTVVHMRKAFNGRSVSEKGSGMQRLVNLALTLGLLATSAFAQTSGSTDGSVHGDVFTVDGSGARTIVLAAKVSLEGPIHVEAESDGEGKFAFGIVPPGSYTIAALAPGMVGQQGVTVAAGNVSEIELEMKVAAVADSTTVTANAEANDAKESSAINTIGESALRNMPNLDERFNDLLPLVPGVVRGRNGQINMKGARSSQNGSLLNDADVTDPATGTSTLNIPIDVVSSVQIFSTPYDPEYGKFTGAVSNVETRPGNFSNFRFSAQNLLPRMRRVDGTIMGIAAATPRVTVSGPVVKDKIAFTQSLEYRYERAQVYSLPPLEAWTRSENLNSYTQIDANIRNKQTATASFAVFPQKLDYYGLNTFTPQESTPDLHQRGFEAYLQHRYITDSSDLLTSQVSIQQFDADLRPNSIAPYQMLVETTKGGFFNTQDRNTTRTEWAELYHSHPHHFLGSHELDAGATFARSSYDGRQEFRSVQVVGRDNYALERIDFGPTSNISVHQNEVAWFAGDKWSVSDRLAVDLGIRLDWDSVTGSVNAAPRAGFTLSLTGDGKTVLKGGAGFFYDRVPLNIPAFRDLPNRTVTELNSAGGAVSSTEYSNVLSSDLNSPRGEVWNVELNREITSGFLVRAGYLQRLTARAYFVNPVVFKPTGILELSNHGGDIYKELQVSGIYRLHHSTLNASYVHSRAYGDLNDINQFFGNDPVAVIQPNQRARLSFDAPNRFLAWGEIAVPWKVTVAPVLDVHSGFAYSTVNQYREFVGPRNEDRFPEFVSTDLQVWRRVHLPIREMHARIGAGAYNLFNRDNYRDVQNDVDSARFGEFFNGPARTFHGKFVLEF
ncbi:ATP-binding protein [Occallatibacter riparius]|uniref:TonB-dependent receptor n=1 Tax=Occallatibacter riparius TaxID=1002689 RepID=A0A9J7BQU7_9BACT|nr:ATP-binding protein [Occallatibacter riparius]UWZ85195.1 TonB-dependent receptor [Occallatibacter riparius]